MLELTTCRVDLVRGVVHRDGVETELTTREADLLRYLVANPSRRIPRDELLANVWQYSDAVVSRACDNAVRRLREKIEAEPARPDHVLTIHGAGYRFVGPGSDVVPAPVAATRVVLVGRVRVDVDRLQLHRGDAEPVKIGQAEASVLEALVRAGGAVVDREDLGRAGWGRVARGSRVVAGAISRLRGWLEDDPAHPTILLTARDGYQLIAPAERPPTALLGRDDLLDETARALAAARWVLLLGPAGVGKSALAREIADRTEGAVWVDLESATDPSHAARLVARSLEVELGRTDPIDRVAAALGVHRPPLLVLDNVERIDVRDAVERWSATGVRLLGTSRRRVGADGERVIEVGPLAREAAVALFVRRARAATSVNAGIDRHAEEIGTLVDRLECIPLAIELAAARTATLGVADLLRHLNTGLLSRSHGPERHRTLRGVIDATFEALPPPLVDALQQLVLFRAGFFVDDARGVLGDDAIDRVQGLRDHSILAARPGAHLRFQVWEAIRERLDELGPPDPARVQRHVSWLARWGQEEALDHLGYAGTEETVARMRLQVEDLAGAVGSAVALGAFDVAAACGLAACWVYTTFGPPSVGRALLDRVLASPLPGALRARLVHTRGLLEYQVGEDLEVSCQEALRLAVEFGADPVEYEAAMSLVRLRMFQGRWSEIPELAGRAASAARRADRRDGRVEWAEYHVLAATSDAGPDHLERAVATASRSGNLLFAAKMSFAVYIDATNLYRCGRAQAAAEQAYELFLRFGHLYGQAQSSVALGEQALIRGDAPEARRWITVAAELARRLDSVVMGIVVMRYLALIRIRDRDFAGAAEALRTHAVLKPDPTPIDACHLEEAWFELHAARGDPATAAVHAARAASAWRAMRSDCHAAGVMAKAAATWLAAGDAAAAREALAGSVPGPAAQDAVPHRLPTRVAGEALLARADGRAEEAASLFAELGRHPLFADLPTDTDDQRATLALGLPL